MEVVVSTSNYFSKYFIVVFQSLSSVQLFATPWTAECQASLSFTISQSLPKFMSIASVMPSGWHISLWIFSYKMTRLFFVHIFCISFIYYKDLENIYTFSLRTLVITSKFWKNKLQVSFSSTVDACSITLSHLTLCDPLPGL